MTSSAPSDPVAVTVPTKLHPPIDVSKIKKENGVKALIKELLDAHGWFHFAVAAGGYSAPGGLRTKQQLLAIEGFELRIPADR